jgi:hypothetical protein
MHFAVKPAGHRTKALFIGINYVGYEHGRLSGCHDVKLMKQFINSQFIISRQQDSP